MPKRIRPHTAKEAARMLAKIGSLLTAGMFKHTVYLVTHDSCNVWQNATAKTYGDFVLIWTEHHGDFFEHRDEILHFRLFKEKGTDIMRTLPKAK